MQDGAPCHRPTKTRAFQRDNFPDFWDLSMWLPSPQTRTPRTIISRHVWRRGCVLLLIGVCSLLRLPSRRSGPSSSLTT
uniref:Putative LOC100213573 [Hydra vulgaris] n=1 Tax=Lepeophtheirus salmonis TaxID=72036 RepID=A0A0K2TEV7_LEPSM